MSKIKILSTKKLNHSEKGILSDFDLIDEDFIQIELLNFDIDIAIDIVLLFTSKNAVLSVLQNEKSDFLKRFPCVCVGEKTKELLEENNFEVLNYSHYAEDLTKIISEKHSNKSFLFFCGNLRRNVLPDFFKANGIPFEEIQVYENRFSSVRIEEKPNAILFFSPSGVRSYLLNNTISDEICFCIGTTTADELLPYTNTIILSEKPTIQSLITKVKEYFTDYSR